MTLTYFEQMMIVGLRAGNAALAGGYRVCDRARVLASIDPDDLPPGVTAEQVADELAADTREAFECIVALDIDAICGPDLDKA